MKTKVSDVFGYIGQGIATAGGLVGLFRSIFPKEERPDGGLPCRTKTRNERVRCKTCGGAWLLTPHHPNPWPEICPYNATSESDGSATE